MLYKVREGRLDIANERRTAGAGKKSLFGKLLCLFHSNHIRTESRLDNVVEAEHLESRNDLTELSVCKLARNRGSNHGVNPVISATGIALALFKNIDYVDHIGLVHNSAERALIYTRPALYALGIIYRSRLFLVHRDSLDLARVLAGALAAYYRGIRANLRARSAFLAL